MERYEGVRGGWRVKQISAALEACGAKILASPDPSVAPFEYTIMTPEGEILDLVCYAFTANKYRQGGRPTDEHRFQVKYGSQFDRVHELFIDPTRRTVTLMFGVHEELGLFVAVDPLMHRVTWFSSSIEFKEPELLAALESGWHGWERERVHSGRRQVDPRQDMRVEAVMAFRPEHFLRYVQLERLTAGLDPAERLLFIDRWQQQLETLPGHGQSAAREGTRAYAAPATRVVHPLEEQLGLSLDDLMDVIAGRGRLLTAVLGGVAERHLEQYLLRQEDLRDVRRLDEDGQPDFVVRHRRRPREYRIECKNVRARPSSRGPWVDFQKTRASKGDPCSRYYARTQFEVLAACLHPISRAWEFRFTATAVLPAHKRCVGRIATNIHVEEDWTHDICALLMML